MCKNGILKKSKWRPWGIYSLFIIWASLGVISFPYFSLPNHFAPIVGELCDLIFVSLLVIHYKKEFPDLLKLFRPIPVRLLFGTLVAFFIFLITDIFIPFLSCGELAFHFNSKTLLSSLLSWQNTISYFAIPTIVGPIIEEILFRGVLLKLFLSSYKVPTALILNGLAFGVLHIAPLPGFGYCSILVNLMCSCCFGVLLSAVTYKTKNLSFAFGFHVANNFLALLTE